jgi:hypothetical protein
MDRFMEYQSAAEEGKRFAGLHLDVEPHQYAEFAQCRDELLGMYLDFVIWVCSAYPIPIDFDIPFWFNDEVTYQGERRKLYEAVITEANRVFVMSYRDQAEKMYETAKEKIAFAQQLNKGIVLCAETLYSSEGDQISYFEEGKAALYTELRRLKSLVNDDNCGLAVHHIMSWYDLKD